MCSLCNLERIQSTVKSVLFFSLSHSHFIVTIQAQRSVRHHVEQFMFVYLAFNKKRFTVIYFFVVLVVVFCVCFCFVFISVVFSVFRFVDLAWLRFFSSLLLVAIMNLFEIFISWYNPWNSLQNGYPYIFKLSNHNLWNGRRKKKKISLTIISF